MNLVDCRFSLMFIVWLATILLFGWFLWPQTSPFPDSHAFGLRFMPACTPFGADAMCDYDMLLVAPIAIGAFFCVFELFVVMQPYDLVDELKRKVK